MYKSRKILRGIALAILLSCTVYVAYSIISNPLGEHNTFLPLAVCAGFIVLGSNKNRDKSK